MCARRFLFVIFFLTLVVVAGAFAVYQWGGRVLVEQAVPKGHFEAAKAGGKKVQVTYVPVGHHQMTEAPDETLFAMRDFLRS